ncbi:ferric-chelate reductase (Fre2) [Rhizoctonia solani AG-3 Rhs1AP]|uniref:Ferric-chelate reductase (Fre2) n=1 Tax=Rhizoctonia solani AG-3 Rhs1AP TaxID=1086054 RepID=X8JA17_9AGAM|nr:ferric-chelate reductase (Fre2) [Rhizoctonia solani AG-3 Rhs1AP]
MKCSVLLGGLAFVSPALAIFQLGCGETCNGVIDAYDLACSPDTKQHHGTSSDLAVCQAESQPYLSTVAWCIRSRCTSASDKDIQHYWSWVQGNRKVNWPSYESVLPASEPPLVSEDMEVLNSTIRITDESYWAEYETQMTFSYIERWHVRAGYIMIALVIASCMIGTVQYLYLTKFYAAYSAQSWRSSATMTWFKKHLVLPALFRSSHRQPVLSSMGYLPSRLATVFLALFVILNIIFLATPIKSVQPNTWSSSRKLEVNNYVANRAGIISFALLPLTVLLSARNNPLVYLTRMTQNTYILVHRWVARMCALQAVIHSVAWTIQWYWEKPDGSKFRAEAVTPYMRWGFAGTVALCVMVALAAWPIRHRSYELFIFLHIALGIVSLLGCWYHMDFRFGVKYGYKNWLFVTFGIWGADRIIRALRMIYLSWPALTQKPNTLAHAELVPGQSALVKLTIPTRLAHSAKPGQYAFVHFASLFKPWENHPFSIAGWNVGGEDEEKPEFEKRSQSGSGNGSVPSFTPGGPYVTMVVRAHGGATGRIRDTILANRGPVVLPVLLEGPYGHPQPLDMYETQVLIAGGVGVTALTGYIQSFLTKPNKTKRVMVVWAAREVEFIQFMMEHKLDGLPENVQLCVHCTGPDVAKLDGKYAVESGRPSLTNLVQFEVTTLSPGERIAFFVSGSGSMSDQVRRAVVDCIGSRPEQIDGDRINFFDEVFAWMASRRENRMAAAQNDALMEFENFKKKYLLVNKHVTKLNSTLSVRIEELNDQIAKLQMENLRLRNSNMSLVARLKREPRGRGSDPKTVAVIDAATAEALRQLNVIRDALVNAKPCSPSHSIPTPPSTSPPSRITGPVHPGLNTRVPVARAPEFPPLSESSESARVKSRRRSLGGMTDDEDSEMEHPVRVTRRGGHGIPAPSYLESESEAELESKARRRTGRQSALLARGDDEREKSPIEPVVEIPVKSKSKPIAIDAKRSKRKLVESEPDDAIKSVGVIVDLPVDEEEFKPQHVRAQAVNKLQDVTNSPVKASGRIRDTIKVMEDEDEPVVTGGYIGTPAISKISKPPRSRTFIPAPTSSSGRLTPTSGTDDDPTGSGRERRTRKSVNYAEPKLNTKMRKPTPDATSYGRFSLPSAKPRISTSIPRDSSPPPESPMPPLLDPNTNPEDAVTVRARRRRPTSVATDDDDGAGTEYLDPDDDYVPTIVTRKSGGKLATDRRYSAAA